MKITQVRSATIIVEYNNKKFLIDPWLMPKDYMPGFDSAINSQIRQPRVELPFGIEKIVDVDAVIITHIHPDHWELKKLLMLMLLLSLISTLTTGMNLQKKLWIKI